MEEAKEVLDELYALYPKYTKEVKLHMESTLETLERAVKRKRNVPRSLNALIRRVAELRVAQDEIAQLMEWEQDVVIPKSGTMRMHYKRCKKQREEDDKERI